MRLAEYLKHTNQTQGAFAEKCETSQGRISQLLKGELPSMKLATRIEVESCGLVTLNDWVPASPSASAISLAGAAP